LSVLPRVDFRRFHVDYYALAADETTLAMTPRPSTDPEACELARPAAAAAASQPNDRHFYSPPHLLLDLLPQRWTWVGSVRGLGCVERHSDGLGHRLCKMKTTCKTLHFIPRTITIKLVQKFLPELLHLKLFQLVFVMIRIPKLLKVCNNFRLEIVKNSISYIAPHKNKIPMINLLGCLVGGLGESVYWYDGLGRVGSVSWWVGYSGLVW